MIKIIIIVHLILFESMFFVKNMLLKKKLNVSIRGKNKEATISIILITVTIVIALISVLSEYINEIFIPIEILSNEYTKVAGIILLFVNLLISFLVLIQMRDSWRIGIKEGDKTELINEGIFKISRNPYFLSYIILFLAYIFMIGNFFLIFSILISIISINKMIIKEEKFLEALHGKKYLNYKAKVPRYFLK